MIYELNSLKIFTEYTLGCFKKVCDTFKRLVANCHDEYCQIKTACNFALIPFYALSSSMTKRIRLPRNNSVFVSVSNRLVNLGISK